MLSYMCIVSRSNVLQESLIKLVEACNDQSHSMDRWLSKLEASNWQTHVKEIDPHYGMSGCPMHRQVRSATIAVKGQTNSQMMVVL